MIDHGYAGDNSPLDQTCLWPKGGGYVDDELFFNPYICTG